MSNLARRMLADTCCLALAGMLAFAWPAAAGADRRAPLVAGAEQSAPMAPGAMAIGSARSGAFVVQASSDRGSASGTLQRRSLQWSSAALQIGSDAAWDAGARLTGSGPGGALPPPQERRIYTLDTWTGRFATVPFKWEFLGAGLRTLYGGDAPGPGAAPGARMLAYLRGERSSELGQANGIFRKRRLLMGDVGNNTPLVVGPPADPRGGSGYQAFRSAAAARPTVIYLGANDGMLHAFDADSGAELFAYVPAVLAGRLGELSKPDYRSRPYVDASAGHGDALIRGQWRSILACGLGGGGRGVFALDITQPAQMADGLGALWEFSDADDAGMGGVSAPPVIAVVKLDGQAGQTPGHVVLVASGRGSGAGHPASLFLLALDKAADAPWLAGRNYFRLRTSGEDLSAPGLVLGPDGVARYAYAGDLQGNLWRFDLTRKSSRRVFIARDQGGRRQPIGHAPKIVYSPGSGYLVLFGTGVPPIPGAAAAPRSVQSLYAVHDDPDADADADPDDRDAAATTRDALVVRTVTSGPSHVIHGAAIDYFTAGARKGWYLDLPGALTAGERTAATPVVQAGGLVFETLAQGPGETTFTRLYMLEAISGLAFDSDGLARSGQQTAQRAPSSSTLASLIALAPAVAGERNPTGQRAVLRQVVAIRPEHSTEVPIAGAGALRQTTGRMGWREVANWPELHANNDRKKTKE